MPEQKQQEDSGTESRLEGRGKGGVRREEGSLWSAGHGCKGTVLSRGTMGGDNQRMLSRGTPNRGDDLTQLNC